MWYCEEHICTKLYLQLQSLCEDKWLNKIIIINSMFTALHTFFSWIYALCNNSGKIFWYTLYSNYFIANLLSILTSNEWLSLPWFFGAMSLVSLKQRSRYQESKNCLWWEREKLWRQEQMRSESKKKSWKEWERRCGYFLDWDLSADHVNLIDQS